MKTIIYISLGGALGTLIRYLVTKCIQTYATWQFPWGTFVVNIVGCLIIGVLFSIFEKYELLSSDLRLFLTVGFCGGFTTFSSYINESYGLIREGLFVSSFIYLIGSLVLGFIALLIGYQLVKLF